MDGCIVKFFKNEKILLSVVLTAFLFLLVWNIKFPGLESDEACDGIWASYIIHSVPAAERVNSIMSVNLFNRTLPIMANTPYIGAVESYLLVPFFLVFGINIFSLRIMPITIALISVLLIYLLCKEWLGRKAAFITLLLTVTNPFFVMYSRIGLYREELFSTFFFWSGLLCFWVYLKKKKFSYLCLGSFLFGLGLSTKIMFLWYIIGMAIACLILRKKRFSFPGMGPGNLISAISAFFLGNFLLVFYNIKTGGNTLRLMWKYLFSPTPYGVSNLSYLHNLNERIGQFFKVLKGDFYDVRSWVSPEFVLSKDYLTPVIFVLGFAFVLLILFFKKGKYSPFEWRKILFFYIVYSVMFICSPFTMSFVWLAHLFILFPFPQIIIALFLCNLLYLFRSNKPVLFIVYFTLSFSVLSNITTVTRYHLAMRKSGGVGAWSTVIYELSEYLYTNKIFNPLALEWGFHHNIPFLTGSKVRPENLSGYSLDGLVAKLKERLSGGGPLYVITTTDTAVTNNDERARFESVNKVIKEFDRTLMLSRIFLNRSGSPVYYLYEIR